MSNEVEIVIKAKDESSAVIKGASSSAREASDSFEKLDKAKIGRAHV